MNMSILFYAVKFGNLCRNMPCNNCAFIRVVFFRELYFEEMCGSAETTQKSKRSRSQNQPDLLHENWKQLRRVSGAEERTDRLDDRFPKETTQKSKRSRRLWIKGSGENKQPKQLRRVSGAEEFVSDVSHYDFVKQLRRVSGVNNYHKILTIII